MVESTHISSDLFYLEGLKRHFADLRDGTHGDGAKTREDKEALFHEAAGFLDPYARQVLREINDTLLLGKGRLSATGVFRSGDGDLSAEWALVWAAQEERGIQPVRLRAVFGRNFMHPHLCGATVGYWPLNIFSESEAAGELATLRAVAAADLHNLVFQSDFRIIPAVTADRIHQMTGSADTT